MTLLQPYGLQIGYGFGWLKRNSDHKICRESGRGIGEEVAVTQEANDVKQLRPMLTQAQENLESLDFPAVIDTALADADFCSETNLTEADPAGPELLIASNKDWKHRPLLVTIGQERSC